MVRKYVKKAKPYNDGTLVSALHEIQAGASIKKTSKKYKIGYGKLWADFKAYKECNKAVLQQKKKSVSSKLHIGYFCIYIYRYIVL